MIPRFHYDLRPSGTLMEYRLHLSNNIYIYIYIYVYCLKNILHSRINKTYITAVRSNTFWPSQLKADHLGEFNFSHFTKIWKNTKQLIKHSPIMFLRLSYGFTARHLPGENRKILGPKPTLQACPKHYI